MVENFNEFRENFERMSRKFRTNFANISNEFREIISTKIFA